MTGLLNPYRFGAAAFAPTDIPDLKVWHAADTIVGKSDGDTLPGASSWIDLSGNGHHLSGSAGSEVRYETGETPAGGPAVSFPGQVGTLANRFMSWPNVFTALTSGEIFMYIKSAFDPAGAGSNTLYRLGSSSQDTHHPWTDGSVYETFGTTARKSVGNLTPSLANWHKWNVRSAAGAWSAHLDGTQVFSTGSNTVGWSTSPALGISGSSAGGWEGFAAEIIMYSRVLTAGERTSVMTYLARHD